MFQGNRTLIRLGVTKPDATRPAPSVASIPIIPVYGTNSVRTSGNAELRGNDIILKGVGDDSKNIKISLAKFEEHLVNLRPHHASRTVDLPRHLLDDYNNVKHIVALVMPAGAGDLITEPINKIFGDIKHTLPGTVGAYLLGCYVQTNLKGNQSCAPICTGSIQPHKSTGHTPCDVLTLLYTPGRGFQRLNRSSNNEDALIYYHNSQPIPLHSLAEIKELNGYGVKRAKQITYDGTGKVYEEKTPEFVSVEHLMQRDIPAVVNVSPNGGSSSSGATVAIIILLAIIVIGGIYVYNNQKKKGVKNGVFFE